MKECRNCKKSAPLEAAYCNCCGASLTLVETLQGARPLSPEARIEQLQNKLNSISARRRAVKSEWDKINSQWNILHVELHDLQLKTVEVKKLEAKKPAAPRAKKPTDMKKTILASKLSWAEKLKLAEMFGVNLD
jgi:hypothetical protein